MLVCFMELKGEMLTESRLTSFFLQGGGVFAPDPRKLSASVGRRVEHTFCHYMAIGRLVQS
jgi:hypothetical protein